MLLKNINTVLKDNFRWEKVQKEKGKKHIFYSVFWIISKIHRPFLCISFNLFYCFMYNVFFILRHDFIFIRFILSQISQ